MATNGDTEEAGRRKSGRTIRKPNVFGDEPHEGSILSSGSTKRKRNTTTNGNHDTEQDEDDSDEDPTSDDESEESEPGEEELKEQRKQKAKAAPMKPAAKRAKTTNGSSTTLAIRSATGSKPKTSSKPVAKTQKARSRPSQVQATGLFADVFGRGNTEQEAAAIWHDILEKDNVAGIRDLINFVLQCIGCDVKIESADVEDIDNVPSRLGDILDEYTRQKNSEYPLASKSKQHAGFREVLSSFFSAIIHALHNSSILYDEAAVYDNIHIWIATMSGAGYRAFRHTATVASLAMTTALCEIAQKLQSSMSTTKTQLDAEKKKKTANKKRASDFQADMKKAGERLAHIDTLLRDAFDTVYVHRYRDVDEKIRVECVTALGHWIDLYRSMFLEGQYLRYLGWVMSDPNASTRLEVIRALKGLFKDRKNVGALRAFIERFRSRVVEMGCRDTDTNVRAETIELLDRLRNVELLKPDDIDAIGQLIFDNEPRVRKAVAKFFVSNIHDLYDSSIEELDPDQLATALPPSKDVDDFLDPSQVWVKFKCLAQTLASHDRDNESRKSGERQQEIYGAEDAESRYMLAAQSIYPSMPELQEWESLAGYLLFDHSSIDEDTDSVGMAYKLQSGEDTILLDVLHYAVKLSLQRIVDAAADKKSKRTNASKDDSRRKQEAAAQHLTVIIPQLLNKLGSTPEAAASILRLEQLLDIDLINDLQSGEASYTTILEDINKQLISHNDRKVLAEASKALRAARTYETSQEAVDAKLAEIWAESKETLTSLLLGKNITARGTIDKNVLRGMGDVMGRLAQLAAVSDCTEVIESRMSGAQAKKGKSKSKSGTQDIFLDVLMQLMSRGGYDEDTTEQFAALEDRLCASVMTVLSLYFRWKVVGLKEMITTKDSKSLSIDSLSNLALQRSSFVEAILPVISTRSPLDPLRVDSILTILDLFTLFATVRHMKPTKGKLDDNIQSSLAALVTDIPADIITLVMESHEKMEKRLAHRNKKRIELPLQAKHKNKRRSGTSASHDATSDAEVDDVEKPPEDSDEEENNASDSEDDEGLTSADEEDGKKSKEAKKQASLLAEQALCELTSKIVLGTIAGIIGSQAKIKERLQVNRTKLGKSYSSVVAYLDEKKLNPKSKAKKSKEEAGAKSVSPTATKTQAFKSNAMVLEDDDIEDEDMEDNGEEGDEEDLRRKGLDDDPIEEDGEAEQEDEDQPEAEAEDDEILGD